MGTFVSDRLSEPAGFRGQYRRFSRAKYLPREWQEVGEKIERFEENFKADLGFLSGATGVLDFDADLVDYALRDVSEANFHTELAQVKRQNMQLRSYVESQMPHRQILKTSWIFLVFFSLTLSIQNMTPLQLMNPVLAWAGMGFSAVLLGLSCLAGLDWVDWKRKAELHDSSPNS